MALVGFLLVPSVLAKSTSSAEPVILNSLTARNAGLWVQPLTDTVRGHQNIANKGFRIACDETFPSFKLFCNKFKKTLKIFTESLKIPPNLLKSYSFLKVPKKIRIFVARPNSDQGRKKEK